MATPQIEIVVFHGETEVFRKTLPSGEYVIGSEDGVEVVLATPQVAPRHARLTIDDEALFVEDLGSEAGTFIDGRAVKDNTRVWPTQEVRIGSARLEAHLVKDAGDAAGETLVPKEVVAELTYEIDKILTQKEESAILDTHDSAIRRDLAMKVLRPDSTEEEVARFVEEAQITGQLEHPNIPPIHQLGTDEQGRPYYTMKVVRGVTLGKVLELIRDGQAEARARYSLRVLLNVLQRTCEGVAFAHSKGVIHRALKPKSIDIGDFGEVLVTDWEHAKYLEVKDLAGSPSDTAAIAGAPHYMAPEQARGEFAALDARTDVYSLGAILYHILTLRPPILEEDHAAALKRVGEAHTDRLDVGQSYAHLPRKRIPDPLAAIVGKAMAAAPAARYQRVCDLQTDLEAYQSATITAAEQVGPIRQFFFVVRRYKTVSLAAAIVVGSSLFFGGAAILESLRAKREAARAGAFVNEVKNKAPVLLKLAESESDAQQFEVALRHIDTSLALDPSQPRAYWERAWALLGLERWDDATAALKVAQQHDPTAASTSGVLAAIAKMKTIAADPQRWKNDATRELLRYLQSAGATGPALSLVENMKENAEARKKLIDQRLTNSLGRDHYRLAVDNEGMVELSLANQAVRSLDPIRGLQIDSLDLSGTPLTDIEQLRGLRLQSLNLSRTRVVSLVPVMGVPLRKLVLDHSPVRELSPIRTAPLYHLSLEGTKVYDLTALKGMPLRSLNLKNTVIVSLASLRGLPLESLNLSEAPVQDLSPLEGMPLKELDLRGCRKLTSYRPVLSLPNLEHLSCDVLPEELAPLRQSKTLQTIEADVFPGEDFRGARPVAIFWADYDARKKGTAR